MPLFLDDSYRFILFTLTCLWMVAEVFGWSYLVLTKFSFFNKMKKIILVLFLFGYVTTWIFGVPACQKVFADTEKSAKAVETEKGEKKPWWDFHVAFPIFPFLLVTHEGFEYDFQRVKDVQCLYFWNGVKAIHIPYIAFEGN